MNDDTIQPAQETPAAIRRREILWQELWVANRLDLTKPDPAFSTPWHVFKTLDRLRFHPRENEAGNIEILASGLAVVTCPAGIPNESKRDHEWRQAPVFENADGAATCLFAGGFSFDEEVFGVRVESFAGVVPGFPRLARYVTAPITWLRPPTRPKAQLPSLPAAIRFEVCRRLFGRKP